MEILIAIVANLVVGAILLAIFAWRSPPRAERIDQGVALRELRRSFPDAEGEVVVSSDGQAAVVLGSVPRMTYLLQCHGRRYNVRELHSGDVARVAEVGDSIRVRLRDFAWPTCRVSIPDPDRRRECLARLSVLTLNPSHSSITASSNV